MKNYDIGVMVSDGVLYLSGLSPYGTPTEVKIELVNRQNGEDFDGYQTLICYVEHDRLNSVEVTFDGEGQVTYIDTFWFNGDYDVIEHCRSFELFYLLDPETYSWEAMWDSSIREYYTKLKDK